MAQRKRNIIIGLAVIALAMICCALVFTGCKNKKKDVEEGTELGLITLEDSGSLRSEYSLEIGEDVYSYVQSLGEPQKDHAQFAYWEYDGKELTKDTGLKMTQSVTLTAKYKIEVTVAVYARDCDPDTGVLEDGYTHMYPLDYVDYEFAGETYTANVDDLDINYECLSEESGKNSTSSRTITVSSSYSQNEIKIYFLRRELTVRFGTNYPSALRLTDEYWTETVYFGYPLELPSSGYECTGYLMLGWSDTTRATYPQYAVDSVSEKLLIWNDEEEIFELKGTSDERTTFYPSGNTGMYITWGRGYTYLFGGDDAVYILDEEAGSAYLYRGGFFWESTEKIGDVYYFTNYYTGKDNYYRIRIGEDGATFTYWDEYISGIYYHFFYIWDYDYGYFDGYYNSTEYIIFDNFDGFTYYTSEGDSTGYYRLYEDGFYRLTFTSGPMEGETATIVLGILSDTLEVFMFQDEDTALGYQYIGTSYYYDEYYGIIKDCYDESYTYLYLDGFNNLTYYYNGSTETYQYWIDGDVMYVYYFYSYYNEYELVARFKYCATDYSYTDTGETVYAWFQLESNYLSTYEVCGASGEVLGSVYTDGYTTAYYTKAGDTSTTWTGTFAIEYLYVGDAIYIGGTGAEETYYSKFVFAYDDDWNVYLSLVPNTYQELYLYTAEGMDSYDMMILDYDPAVENSAAYVIIGYDYYGYGYYFTVLEGTYEIYVSEDYPELEYYVMTVSAAYDWEEYFENYYVYIYYPALDLGEYPYVSEIGFVTGSVTLTSGYSYPVYIWMWYDKSDEPIGDGTEGEEEYSAAAIEETEKEPLREEDHYMEYFEEYSVDNLEIWLYYEIYELEDGYLTSYTPDDYGTKLLKGKLDFLMLEAGLGYANFTVGEAQNLRTDDTDTKVGFVVYYYGDLDVETNTGKVTATCYLIELSYIYENTSGGNQCYIYGYGYVYAYEDEDQNLTQVTEIPGYIYEYSMADGLDTNVYFSYNAISMDENLTYTYHDAAGDDHTGTIALKETDYTDGYGNYVDEFGYYVFVFTDSSDADFTVEFVSMTYGNYDVFVPYGESKTYQGSDGSYVVLDPIGYCITYVSGGAAVMTSSFNAVLPGEDEEEFNEGHYGAGMIQIIANGSLITLDFYDDSTKASLGTSADYSVRGWEWGEYYVVYNFVDQGYVALDGYGGAVIYSLEIGGDGSYTQTGTGTYTLTDTVVSLTYTLTAEDSNGGATGTFEAELDPLYIVYYLDDAGEYVYMLYGDLYVNDATYTGTYINVKDLSVLELGSLGEAVRYTAGGETESGIYTWITDKYFFYSASDGSFGSLYRVTSGFNAESVDYSGYASTYFTNDMTSYIEFYSNGRVTFDEGSTYWFYIVENSSITVYYAPSAADREYANKCGYAAYDFGAYGETFTPSTGEGNTKYYNLKYIGGTYTLERPSEDANKYNYSYGGGEYTIGNLVLDLSQTTGEEAVALLYLSGGTMYAYIYREEKDEGVGLYMVVYTVYATYYDYLYYIYDITVDLSKKSYTITSEYFYVYTFQYEYLFDLIYYGGYYAEDYSELLLEWQIDENGQSIGQYAYGYILPYVYYTLSDDGEYIYPAFYVVSEFTMDEYGYFYIDIPVEDEETGEETTYQLVFWLSVYDEDYYVNYYWCYYYGVNYFGFVTMYLWIPFDYETEHIENESYYELYGGYSLFSSYYGWDVTFVSLYRWTYDTEIGYTVTYIEPAAMYYMGDTLYIVQSTGSGYVYYAVDFQINEEETDYESITVTRIGTDDYIVYNMDDGGYVHAYTDSTTGETVILLVSFDGTTDYCVYSCEYDESSGSYSVTLSDGGNYTVELTAAGSDPDISYSATVE